jgi:hypothetical protein
LLWRDLRQTQRRRNRAKTPTDVTNWCCFGIGGAGTGTNDSTTHDATAAAAVSLGLCEALLSRCCISSLTWQKVFRLQTDTAVGEADAASPTTIFLSNNL